jgi:tetratricopeptide (TPR) repeat protein
MVATAREIGYSHSAWLLNETLSAVAAIGNDPRLQLEVLHAREICSCNIDTMDAVSLALWIARYDFERGAYESAVGLREKVLESRKRSLGQKHPDTLSAMRFLAVALYLQGDLQRAKDLLEEGLEMSSHYLGEDHQLTIAFIESLGTTLSYQGDLETGRKRLEKAVEISRRTLGEKHPDTSNAEWNLLANLLRLSERSAAVTVFNSLAWLLDCAPETLTVRQREIRTKLEEYRIIYNLQKA